MVRSPGAALFLGLLAIGTIMGLAIPAALAREPEEKVDHSAIAATAVADVIRPGYEAFAGDAKTLAAKTKTLCADPSEAALGEARAAFVDAVKSWSAVEVIQFGPVVHEHRFDRLFFWPDKKGLGTRQISAALAKKHESVTSTASLAKKSIALQGLPALEYLLYGKGQESLSEAGEGGKFRCRFALAVSNNIAQISSQVAQDWGVDAPFTKSFLKPAVDGALYRAPKDVTLELFKVFSGGIERVRDKKLGAMLGKSAEHARPRWAPFWRSGLSFSNISINLDAVLKMFNDAGFAGIVASESSGVEDSIRLDLQRSAKTLSDIAEPVAEVVANQEDRDRIRAIRLALKSANGTATEFVSEGAGLSFGFNAGDGD